MRTAVASILALASLPLASLAQVAEKVTEKVAEKAAPVTMQAGTALPDAGTGLVRSVIGLVVVLALIMACAWLAKRFGNRVGGGKTQLLKTISALPVGQRESVVVVELGEQWLVLGVAPGRVNALAQLPRQALPEAEQAAGAKAFAQLLARARPEQPSK
ncbi:MAG: flagellar biosynthetic protein FliO [Burkholderiales bacterium]|nr:flagellar biosynthetic protein FliO [Burkholderiales bacterium]